MSQKMKIVGFGVLGHVQKSRDHRHEGFEGSPRSKSKSYKTKMEQNNSTELLSLLFPYTDHTNEPNMTNGSLIS